MDEDIFPELCLMNTKKTYSKTSKKQGNAPPVSNNVKEASKPSGKVSELGEPLTTKVAVEYLLSGKLKSEVCRYCLRISPGLSELDQIMQIAGTGAVYKITIREMIACFYPFKVSENQEFPESICQKCVDKALNAYLFTQQCEQAERALNNCFIDMDEKLTKLDPIDRPKKRGRQKLKPNYNVLYAEHKKVMDYAEPIRHLINLQTESLSNEPDWNEFECKKCWQVLPNLETLLNHEKLHPKTMWYHCRLCGKAFIKHNQLKKHHTQVHVRGKQMLEADKTFKCKECGNVTENYEQHLQHIEKHKFKSVMEHLIEKKTDQLCLICLKKSSNLVELDKMVCIHGSCPELVGDKTLYTVLASTLPDRKSYKYQELHIPQKANIMTITKRKRKYQETEEDSIKIKFDWSDPIIVKAEKFRTDDFYHYVFCDPDPNFIISTNELKTNNFDVQVSKCIERTDEVAMELDKDNKSETGNEIYLPDHLKSVRKSLIISDDEEELIKMSIHDNINEITDTNIKSLKDDTIEVNFAKNAKVDHAEMDVTKNNYQADEIDTNTKQDNDITNKIYKNRDKINVVERYPETAKTAEPFIIIEETSMMDMKCDTIELKDKETNTIQSMDIEMDLSNNNEDTTRFNFVLRHSQPLIPYIAMLYLHNFIGTKICEQCLNHAITSYVFIHQFIFTRERLDLCISLMLENLKDIEPHTNVFVQVSPPVIMAPPEFDETLLLDENEPIDETKLKVDVLEDEFRLKSDSESEEDRSVEMKPDVKPEYKVDLTPIPDIENLARTATKTYRNKKLVNGLQSNSNNKYPQTFHIRLFPKKTYFETC
ncbi:hypothetical protein B5X24_HaOG214243 [Helicoverpa armigera]|uniref:Uncharacterized protein n=1 Tax=Helicoverpa armigera TaxID=29058 RepID=A0A2W1B360_HELAM|nr:hypothetical protein B5X24_HaOG214243 [Helicoverpa armigera]